MSYTLPILATALTALFGLSENAFAGITATSVPEPATLSLLAIGVGGAAAIKYLKRK